MKLASRAALAALALVSLAGCKQKIDPSKVEALCQTALKDSDIEPKTVTCPKDQEVRKGNDFECTATTEDGDELKMSVTQEDDKGTVFVKVKSGTMDLAKVGDSIEKKIGKEADVKCKSRFVIPKIGKKYRCDVTVDGKDATVEITFEDKKGNLKWKVIE